MTQHEQTDDETADEFKRFTALLVGISELCEGKKGEDVYAALTYCLGKIIGISNDPARLLARTIPKIANAAGINCRQVDDADELEEALNDDSQPAQRSH